MWQYINFIYIYILTFSPFHQELELRLQLQPRRVWGLDCHLPKSLTKSSTWWTEFWVNTCCTPVQYLSSNSAHETCIKSDVCSFHLQEPWMSSRSPANSATAGSVATLCATALLECNKVGSLTVGNVKRLCQINGSNDFITLSLLLHSVDRTPV